jgi:hypothetical protein
MQHKKEALQKKKRKAEMGLIDGGGVRQLNSSTELLLAMMLLWPRAGT